MIAVVVVAGVVGAALTVLNSGGGGTGSAAASPPRTSPAAPPAATHTGAGPGKASGKPSASPSQKPSASSSGTPGGSGEPSGGTDFSRPGSGVFTTAAASGKAVGQGTIRRYKVEVEGGTGVSAKDAAREVETVLADPRGWTDDGHDGFQLVSGGVADFEIKIASPATVDRICGAAGLHTHGEVNCDVGSQVVVNLKRWETGSPEFPGPLHDYRALIINHEVGHRIGHGHEGCPGPGRPAPAMMQQIDGLHGCVANAWPYDSHGTYLAGPPMP
ncbi:DUF3152 domain-containing protein [Streptomyces sp. NBC_01497]|nr:DUF3152 domain-containing protein [Streptomyces sp. NBC_01497]